METLFTIPIPTLTYSLSGVFFLAMLATGALALRRPVVFKMAIRNIPRRKAQTSLIVLGLMLATLLFSASFATGDTLAHSIRVLTLEYIGPVDEIITSTNREESGEASYIDDSIFQKIQDASADAKIDGLTPLIYLTAPVVSERTQRNESRMVIQGFDPATLTNFDKYFDSQDQELLIEDLRDDEVYISKDAASNLKVNSSDSLSIYFSEVPTTVTIKGIYEDGSNATESTSTTIFQLNSLQGILNKPGQINAIFVSNDGGLIPEDGTTSNVVQALNPIAEKDGLAIDEIKKDSLKIADEAGSGFASIFLLFGSFSIIAGILLISLIFVMLAAERKRELGIARAIGAQRDHIIKLFTFEGAVYSLAAAAIGSALGIIVGLVMVRILGFALNAQDQFEFDLYFSFSWQTVILSYTLGMVVTYLVVIVSATRVSALNIVRAVRDIPEPKNESSNLRGKWKYFIEAFPQMVKSLIRLRLLTSLRLLFNSFKLLLLLLFSLFLTGYLAIPLGLLLTITTGIGQEQLSGFLIGLSLIIIGVPLVLKHALRLNERVAYTGAGLLLVILWIVPWDWESFGLPNFDGGIELFILSGVMLVVGAVWAVIYNTQVLVYASSIIARGSSLSPIAKTATAYPAANRLRTGMTIAMFSLVIFTLIVVGFISSGFSSAFEDTRKVSGGFDITASTSFVNPINDINAAIDQSSSLNADDFTVIGATGGFPIKVKQADTDQELTEWFITSIDDNYARTISYDFSIKSETYDSSREIWNALVNEENVVVVNSNLIPRNGGGPFGEAPEFQLEGIQGDDDELPQIFLEIFDSNESKNLKLKVIGVIEDQAVFSRTMITGHQTIQKLTDIKLPYLSYEFVLSNPDNALEIASKLEDAFIRNGLTANSYKKIIDDENTISVAFNRLIQGFMGLGLVVGIAALGVIAARSVVERRVQIGVLRAIGFSRGMVQLSFLLESSFIAILGILIGLGLGFGLAYGIINEIQEGFQSVQYKIPWATVIIVVAVAYGASLLTTFLPARQASRIYPAEALRQDE